MIYPFRVLGMSMEPYCKEGDFVLALSYLFFQPQAGDVIVIKHPKEDRTLVKRIIRVKDKRSYWVEGDNTRYSSDSRDFGWISKNLILGKARVVRALR